MDNKTLVKEWQNWMKAGGVSRNTIKLYTCYIERFGAEKEYLTAQTEDITQWMNRHDWAPYTRAAASLWNDTSAITAIKCFANNANLVADSSFFLYGITKA